MVLVGLMRYIQEDHAAISIVGDFDTRTQQISRSLQKNTSAYTPGVIDTLRSAISLAAAEVENSNNSPQ